MKYIRTQDGRIFNLIAYKEDGEINGGVKYTSKLNGSHLFIQKNNILKQTDTIEECFDEFVIYDIHKKKWLHFIDLKSLLSYCEENGLDKTQIRGAVWTEWGLKYAAKMNSKGELELL